MKPKKAPKLMIKFEPIKSMIEEPISAWSDPYDILNADIMHTIK